MMIDKSSIDQMHGSDLQREFFWNNIDYHSLKFCNNLKICERTELCQKVDLFANVCITTNNGSILL